MLSIAENVGDAITFWVWNKDTEKLIARSVTRDAKDPKNINKQVELLGKDESEIQVPKVVDEEPYSRKHLSYC